MTTPSPHRRALLALLGLVLSVAGPFAYASLMTHASLRSSGAPAWILMAAGLALGFQAVRNGSRWWHKLAFVLSAAFTLFFALQFAVFSALPEPGIAATMDAAPDFTLPDQTGTPVSLAAEIARGPVLLVFYRGAW